MNLIKNVAGKIKWIEMSEEEFRELCSEYIGICVVCGETQDQCEPDATKYECESCGQRSVFGTENLLVMGAIKIT